METVYILLQMVLFGAFISGLIRPDAVLVWSDKPTRLKVVGYYFVVLIITNMAVEQLGMLATSSQEPQKNTEQEEPQKSTEQEEPQGYTSTKADYEQAKDSIKQALDAANDRAEKEIFKTFRIEDQGEFVYITMSDDWYHVPDYMKERLIKFMVQRITSIAEDAKINHEDGMFQEPMVYLKDQYGETLAHGMGQSWSVEE